MKPFITPLAIEGTKEQFERLVPKLLDLGYEKHKDFDYSCAVLVTNRFGVTGIIDTVIVPSYSGYERTTVSADNEGLVLALAAMTDGMEHVKDEWFCFYELSYTDQFTKGKLYKCFMNSLSDMECFIDNNGVKNGFCINEKKFKKATKEQIIQHFMKVQGWGTITNITSGNTALFMPVENRKLLGYKFKEGFEKYKKSAEQISTVPWNYDNLITSILWIETLSAAGLLDLWFEPVYEEIDKVETITLICEGGTFEIQVSKKGIYYAPDKTYLNVDKLRRATVVPHHQVSNYSNLNNYKFSVSHIDSGCKKAVPIEDWIRVIDAYDKLNNS